MLKSITLDVTDYTTPTEYRFAFHCDICHSVWNSEPSFSITANPNEETRAREHEAAYERANLEAIRYFNRCPVCKRMVCDKCLLILPERDVCMVCAKQVDG